jgi:hypothetical protein
VVLRTRLPNLYQRVVSALLAVVNAMPKNHVPHDEMDAVYDDEELACFPAVRSDSLHCTAHSPLVVWFFSLGQWCIQRSRGRYTMDSAARQPPGDCKKQSNGANNMTSGVFTFFCPHGLC